MNEVKKAFKNVQEIFEIIRRIDDEILRQTDNLNMVLINLKIEDARIKENTGIVPIADSIERTIHQLHDAIGTIVKRHRKDLIQSLDILEKHINSIE